MAVSVEARGDTVDIGSAVLLFPTRIVDVGGEVPRPQYDVAADGRFLINTILENSAASPITLIQNWHPEPGK
jgi:hypothetical protein